MDPVCLLLTTSLLVVVSPGAVTQPQLTDEQIAQFEHA